MLRVSGLSVSYGQHIALENASLEVSPGEIVVILGANGAGKTTLLKAVGGVCEGRVDGSVLLNGQDVLGHPANDIVEEGLALVPEGRGIFGDLTVQENLALGAYAARARDEEAGNMERVYGLFPKLRERRRQVVRTMSGGEQQMVAIGRAMMSNPSILALDEPSLGLSPLLCNELFQSLKAVRSSGLGILLVEQNARQSLAIADRGYLLENGHITHEDTAEALMNDPVVGQAYLGGTGGAARSGPVTSRAKPVASLAAAPAAAPAPKVASAARQPLVSPGDIAAQAMTGFQSRSTVGSKPTATPPVLVAPEPVAPPVSTPVEPHPTTPAGPTSTEGMDISGLVARANAISDRRNGAGKTGNGKLPTPPANPRTATNGNGQTARSQPQVSLASGSAQERLQKALKEIEDAARRAEAYRPPQR